MVQPITQTNSTRHAYGNSGGKPVKEAPGKTRVASEDIVSLSVEKSQTMAYTEKATMAYESDPEFDSLKTIVHSLLKRQGLTFSEAMDGKTVAVDEQARKEALDLISENGYWGVEQTSERMFQFAVKGSGGDVSRLDEIKGAIEKGFQMALDAFGGELPDISYKTFDAVMEKLDAWSKENEASEA